MCGISGWTNINSFDVRCKLVVALGMGIDRRGGHSIGYAATGIDPGVRYARRRGRWENASRRFLISAAEGVTTMMHARFATCGDRDSANQAHPFAVKRDGKTVMYGAHNGIIWGAEESAKKYNRPYDVDSRELFELIADGKYDEIQNLSGYGVVTWIEPGKNYINVVKLSSGADIEVAELKGGGIIWASTMWILNDAIKVADLELNATYNLPDTGRVYQIHPHDVIETPTTGIKVGGISHSRHWYSDYIEDDADIKQWEHSFMSNNGWRKNETSGAWERWNARDEWDEDDRKDWEKPLLLRGE